MERGNMSEYWAEDENRTTTFVKIPAYMVEVDVGVWSATYGIDPESYDDTMIQAVVRDVKAYFGSVDAIVDSTGAGQCGAVRFAG